MYKLKIKQIIFSAFLVLTPAVTNAAGLGKLTLISGMGQTLNAEIELSANQDELAGMTAKIASPDVFETQGVERSASLSAIKVEIGKRENGTPIIRLSSRRPINDSFLNLLIQIEWSSGRLLREYTALLDPPNYGARSPVVTPTNDVSKVATENDSSDLITYKVKDITVQRGNTLYGIAKANQIDGISLEQMLVGLYRANPKAFSGKNMNRLKAGKIIHIPAREEFEIISRREAIKEISIQTADWNVYRNRLAGVVSNAGVLQQEAATSRTLVKGSITAQAVDTSETPKTGSRDMVRLSKNEMANLNKNISALQEDATANEKAIKEFSEREAMLKEQLQNMQKLLEIKEKQIAEIKEANKLAAETAPSADTNADSNQPQVAVPDEKKEKPAESSKPKPPSKELTPKPQSSPPSMFDGLLQQDYLLYAIAGSIVLILGGGWFVLRNRRRKELEKFEEGITSTGGLRPNTVFGNTAGGTVDTGSTSFLTGFGHSATAGMIDTSEIDPIAEAEVYMAYGRDSQAEEILKEAISNDPNRYELHVKLLEIFANRNDKQAFETMAGELYSGLDASGPIWEQVIEMGRHIDPDNPLYSDSENATGVGVNEDETGIQRPPAGDEAAANIDIGLNGPDTSRDISLDDVDEPPIDNNNASSSPEIAPTEGLDFTLKQADEGTNNEPNSTSSDSKDPGLGELPELDLDQSGEPVAEKTSEPEAENASEPVTEEVSDEKGLDFHFDTDPKEPADTPTEAPSDDVPVLDLTDINLNIADSDEVPAEKTAQSKASESSNIDTKLDLVTAYIDMGDKTGAQELLQEVIKEGDPEQRDKAQKMLDKLD